MEIDATANARRKERLIGYAPIALALDPSDRSLWVLGRHHLGKFDARGRGAFHRRLVDLAPAAGSGKNLIVNPHEASVWVSAGSLLLHIDADGALLAQWSAPADIQTCG